MVFSLLMRGLGISLLAQTNGRMSFSLPDKEKRLRRKQAKLRRQRMLRNRMGRPTPQDLADLSGNSKWTRQP